MLQNEKYIGDMCLQKGFTIDHLSKRRKSNKGELPRYYVEGFHDAIIDKETFDAVQAEIEKRAAKASHSKEHATSTFTGIIHCEKCGANFQRKINGIGTKYAKVTWACATYTHRGKAQCSAKRIPEDILEAKCAEALGIAEFDEEAFRTRISAITVPGDGILIFSFKDGSNHSLTWEHQSRSESWSVEMKAAASAKMKEGRING